MSWITESNRLKHFLYAIPCAIILTILFVGGLAAGMEFKDKARGIVGQMLQMAIIYTLICVHRTHYLYICS